MVEVSPALRQKQWETLRCESGPPSTGTPGADPRPGGALASEVEPGSRDEAAMPAGDAKLSGVSGFGNVKVCLPHYIP